MDLARYAFRTEWLDVAAALRRQFILLYYKRRDGKDEIELVSRPATETDYSHNGLRVPVWLFRAL